MVEFEPFHSAVNRIPVLRDKAQGLAEDGMLPEDLFATGKAPGHDHLEPEKLSGSIDLEMIVRTPLVFGEQTVDTKGPKDRHFIDLPMDDDGGLVVPPTMIKGMISRAYETLTCSRFRVFGDTEDREATPPARCGSSRCALRRRIPTAVSRPPSSRATPW